MAVLTTTVLTLLAIFSLLCLFKPTRAWLITFYYSMVILKRGSDAQDDEGFRAVFDEVGREWGKQIIRLYDITLEVTGTMPERPCLILCNHQSAFDVPCLLSASTKGISFMPKGEIRKVPGVGRVLERSGSIYLDRSDGEAAKRAMDAAASALKERSFLIFPEGTRSRDGIAGFKKGAFHVATAARVPLLPVALAGSDDPSSLDPSRKLVRLAFGKPIEVKGTESIEGLLTKARTEIIQLNLALGGKGAKPGTEQQHVAPKGNPTKKNQKSLSAWLQP